MDSHTPSPNNPMPSERALGPTPEDLQVTPGAGEQASAPSAQPSGTLPPIPVAKLSPADVAAVIAATPTVAATPPVQGPATAGDVDLIEPEWVVKADQEVAQHRGDPYAEEEAIQGLQQDYLKKRYNIDVASSNGDSGKPKRS